MKKSEPIGWGPVVGIIGLIVGIVGGWFIAGEFGAAFGRGVISIW